MKNLNRPGSVRNIANGTKSDKSDTFQHLPDSKLTPEAINGALTREKGQEERETTRIKKGLFLSIWERSFGSVKATCERTGISRDTYYEWMKSDLGFASEVRKRWRIRLEDVEEQMNRRILQGDGAMIRYFLDRRHPDYMPGARIVIAPTPSEKSLEHEFDELTFIEDYIPEETLKQLDMGTDISQLDLQKP